MTRVLSIPAQGRNDKCVWIPGQARDDKWVWIPAQGRNDKGDQVRNDKLPPLTNPNSSQFAAHTD